MMNQDGYGVALFSESVRVKIPQPRQGVEGDRVGGLSHRFESCPCHHSCKRARKREKLSSNNDCRLMKRRSAAEPWQGVEGSRVCVWTAVKVRILSLPPN